MKDFIAISLALSTSASLKGLNPKPITPVVPAIAPSHGDSTTMDGLTPIAMADSSRAIDAAGMSRSDVFKALKASNNDPEALATSLLQYGQASDTRDAGDCANMTGYEHCTKCAMPSIQNLVTSLFAVQTEVWTDQKTVADQAASVCNAAFPADRYGGNAKCCAAATTASKYAPSGFAGCTADTFSPESTVPVALSSGSVGEADASSNLKYNVDRGFYFEASGTVRPSSLIQDCCTSTSTCRANEKTLSADVATAVAELNSANEGIEAAIANKQATTMQIELQQSKLDRTNAGIRKICLATNHVDAVFTPSTTTTTTMPIDGDTTAQIAAKCPGDCQVKTIVDRQAARKVKISAHKAATKKTREVIKDVIKWLDADSNGNGDGDARHIFDNRNNTRDGGNFLKNGVANADGFDSSLALLESAAAQTTNADALASLKQATSLLQGVGRDGGTGTGGGIAKVIELLNQILEDFANQINQLDTYSTQMDTEEDTELSNLRGQIVNLEAERTAAISQELTLQNSISAFSTDFSAKHDTVNTKMSAWTIAYKSREANANKCKNFMTFFDAETLVNTEELLVLKKAIDIIKHITCGTSQAPTAAPTAFPTVVASAASGAPTAFPTRSPTAAPTAPPSANALANDVGCGAGSYRFLAKVYSDPARFSVPSYTDGIRYALAAGTPDSCQLIKTSHTNVEGAVQTIDHQYKCCGGNDGVAGSFYGAVSYDSVQADGSLCGADVTDHCGLFGANMYMGDTEPNATATQGTFTPTAEPTAYPTRTPTMSPTSSNATAVVDSADRTDTPTAAPTAFPTAAHDAGSDPKYNITMQSLGETAAPTGFPTAAPTAVCTPGTFRDDGASCANCAGGKFSTSYNAGECKSCIQGRYALEGSIECSTCPRGKYHPNGNSDACTSCEKGKFNLWTHRNTCYHCPRGKYQDKVMYHECHDCASGTWTGGGQGKTECISIPTPVPTPYPTAYPTPFPTCFNGDVSVSAGTPYTHTLQGAPRWNGGWSTLQGTVNACHCDGVNAVMTGVDSKGSPTDGFDAAGRSLDDRTFIARCATISTSTTAKLDFAGRPVTQNLFGPEFDLGYSGGGTDKQNKGLCGNAAVMTGFTSTWSRDETSNLADRQFNVKCKPFLAEFSPTWDSNRRKRTYRSSGTQANADFEIEAPADRILTGMSSTYIPRIGGASITDQAASQQDRQYEFWYDQISVTTC
jgi:hypothetical protein